MRLDEKEMLMDGLLRVQDSDLTSADKASGYLNLIIRLQLAEAGLPASGIKDRQRIKNVHARIALAPNIERHRGKDERVMMPFKVEIPEPKPEPEKLEPEEKKSFIERVKNVLKI